MNTGLNSPPSLSFRIFYRRRTWHRVFNVAGPLLLATVLFFMGHLGAISAWLRPPPGYLATWVPRNTDGTQYLTWMRAFQTHFFVPDYHAPWRTGPALFNPALWLASRAALLSGIRDPAAYALLGFVACLAAAWAMWFAAAAFDVPFLAALLASALAVPLSSLRLLPALLLPGHPALPPLAGIVGFVWSTSDGFFHGISGSALVTLGTAMTLLVFGLLARYLVSGRRAWLAAAAAATFCSALLHPFEVFLLASAGPLALVLRHGRQWRRGIGDGLAIAAAGALGLLPYVVTTLRHPWLRAAAADNLWTPPVPWRLLPMLGLPAIAALVLLFMRGRNPRSAADLLLAVWIGCALVEVYLPRMPHSQHLLDGVLYAGALLLVRGSMRTGIAARMLARAPRLSVGALGVLFILSVTPYVIYGRQSFRDGRSADPERLPSHLLSRAEVATRAWMERHAGPDDLVLAPPQIASWLATRPMHALASHQVFSLGYGEQVEFARNFFAGRLEPESARARLTGFGVRFIVAPSPSGAGAYLKQAIRRAVFPPLTIYELPGNRMRDYGGRSTR